MTDTLSRIYLFSSLWAIQTFIWYLLLFQKHFAKTGSADVAPKFRSICSVYLSKLRRDSVGADFQSVRKLTNYVCAKPLELRLSAFRKGS